VRLTVGPSDPALHIRTRDYYQAVLRETKLRPSNTTRPRGGWRPWGRAWSSNFRPARPRRPRIERTRPARRPSQRPSSCPTSWSRRRSRPATNSMPWRTSSTVGQPTQRCNSSRPRQRSAPTSSATWPRPASNYSRLARQAGRCHRPNDDLPYAKPSGVGPALPRSKKASRWLLDTNITSAPGRSV